jgi:hypothetical protein
MLPASNRKVLLQRSTRVPALLAVTGVLLGILIGSSVTYADITDWFVLIGTSNYSTSHYSNPGGGFLSDFWDDSEHSAYADASYPNATEIEVSDTEYTNVYAGGYDAIRFGYLFKIRPMNTGRDSTIFGVKK